MIYLKESILKTIKHSEYTKQVKWIGDCRDKIEENFPEKHIWGIGDVLYEGTKIIYIKESSELADRTFSLCSRINVSDENIIYGNEIILFESTYEEDDFDELMKLAKDEIYKLVKIIEMKKKRKEFNL